MSAITTESHTEERDGKLALLFIINGTSDGDIVQNVHELLML